MVVPAVKRRILDDLGQLSPEQQNRAAELVHSLVSPLPKGTAGRELMRFAGTLDTATVHEMQEAIDESCGRVDLDGW